MGAPEFAPARIPLAGFTAGQDEYALDLDGGTLRFGAVSMGNPHALVEVDAVDLRRSAMSVRCRAQPCVPRIGERRFRPGAGARSHPPARVRAWRRRNPGLRQRRLRGGGGAGQARPRRRGERHRGSLPGGELRIHYDPATGRIAMAGPAAFVFEGEWDPDRAGGKLGAHEVAAWLRRHPQFLKQFPDLALSLVVPRDEGPAASLASYQLEVLRDKNRELSRRLHELFANAQDNERSCAHAPADAGADAAGQRGRHGARDGGEPGRGFPGRPGADRAVRAGRRARRRRLAAGHSRRRRASGSRCSGLPRRRRGLERAVAAGKHALLYGDRGEEVQSSALLPMPGGAWSRSAAATPTASIPAWARCSCG